MIASLKPFDNGLCLWSQEQLAYLLQSKKEIAQSTYGSDGMFLFGWCSNHWLCDKQVWGMPYFYNHQYRSSTAYFENIYIPALCKLQSSCHGSRQGKKTFSTSPCSRSRKEKERLHEPIIYFFYLWLMSWNSLDSVDGSICLDRVHAHAVEGGLGDLSLPFWRKTGV